MFTVKIGYMPGEIKEFTFETPITVSAALKTAKLNPSGYDIKADGVTIDINDNLSPTTKVLALVKRVKGNAVMTLKIGYMPGEIKEFTFETPVTVASALTVAKLNASGYDIKLDGVAVDADYNITSGKVLALVKRVKGN